MSRTTGRGGRDCSCDRNLVA